MRKGTTLLLLAALALAGAPCLQVGSGTAVAAELELTDSGAPSAIVIFPVGETPNPRGAVMPPTAFNHVVHEKWMARAGKDCMICHHTGDAVACTACHTLEGKAEGGFVPLARAMHAGRVAPRKEYTPSSCVSCHRQQMARRECAGCHTTLVKTKRDAAWCTVCHSVTPSMTAKQLQDGMAGKLSGRENERLAVETAAARKPVTYTSPMLAPYKVVIDSLAGEYQPSVFTHRRHVTSLMERIKDNALASAFHTEPTALCATCHHHSPPSVTPPKCGSCHSKTPDPTHPKRPALMAAFHLQCMRCHTDMNVARPRNTDCATCHKPRVAEQTAK